MTTLDISCVAFIRSINAKNLSAGAVGGGVARLFLVQHTKTGENTKREQNIPNGRNIYQMDLQYSKWPQNIPTLSIPRPSKNTQIGTFDVKIYHLATLVGGCERRFCRGGLLSVSHSNYLPLLIWNMAAVISRETKRRLAF
jgi:hypothetical protein